MRRTKYLPALALALLGLSAGWGPALAQEDQAEATFPFEPWHARAAALGGAGVGVTGLEFALVNPAALAGARGGHFDYHSSSLEAQDNALAVAHAGSWGTIGLSIRRRDFGELAEDLGLEGLTAGDQAIALAYANRLLTDRLTLGVAVARLDSEFLSARTGGWSVDAGAQGALGYGIRLGMALLHAGNLEDESGEAFPLPTRLRGGVAWAGSLREFGFAAVGDLAAPVRGDSGADPDAHLGAEARYEVGPVRLGARTGWRSLANPFGAEEAETAWTVGGGIGYGPVQIDIAQALGGELGDELYISLAAHW